MLNAFYHDFISVTAILVESPMLFHLHTGSYLQIAWIEFAGASIVGNIVIIVFTATIKDFSKCK